MQTDTRKGFITVATGSEKYYILAYNLLRSYRYHSKSPMPFAILCDKHNVWTEVFDEVVIIEDPAFSYYDKLRILDLSPFDETIFIDADSLAYRDLNGLWEYFKDSPDIGFVGRIWPKDSEQGWWKQDNLGELKNKVDYQVKCQGGIYYVRNNGTNLPTFLETCQYVKEHYTEYRFTMCTDVLSDETIISLVAAVHHIHPVCTWETLFAYYPFLWYLSADIRKERLSYSDSSGKFIKSGFFIHFGTPNTLGMHSDGLYYREVYHLIHHPDWRKGCRDRLRLFARRLVNHSRFFHTFANLFPKELRNRYNKK